MATETTQKKWSRVGGIAQWSTWHSSVESTLPIMHDALKFIHRTKEKRTKRNRGGTEKNLEVQREGENTIQFIFRIQEQVRSQVISTALTHPRVLFRTNCRGERKEGTDPEVGR